MWYVYTVIHYTAALYFQQYRDWWLCHSFRSSQAARTFELETTENFTIKIECFDYTYSLINADRAQQWYRRRRDFESPYAIPSCPSMPPHFQNWRGTCPCRVYGSGASGAYGSEHVSFSAFRFAIRIHSVPKNRNVRFDCKKLTGCWRLSANCQTTNRRIDELPQLARQSRTGLFHILWTGSLAPQAIDGATAVCRRAVGAGTGHGQWGTHILRLRGS